MSFSNRLALPFIDAAQSQKHVTHNEALVEIDALVQLSVRQRKALAPPTSPEEGDRYLVGASATGAFSGRTNMVAAFDDGGWTFLAPRAGWRTYVEAENLVLLFDGSDWNEFSLSLQTLQNLARLGVGATADASNPLAAKLNNALFTAKSTDEGGTGDLRFTLNKSATANTASQVYQANYSGRAETGLTGDDRFHVKVSADGAAWREALVVDPSTGLVALPQTAGVANGLATLDGSGKVPAAQLPSSGGVALAPHRNRLRNAAFAINQRGVSGTVTLAAGAYGHDGVRAGAGGATYTFAVNDLDKTITIVAGSIIMPVEDVLMEGGGYVLSHAGTAKARIWQGTGFTGSGAYASAPVIAASLAAATQTNVEFSTGTVLRPQLEPGNSPTSFERRPLPFELALCQRYYYRRVSTGSMDVICMMSAWQSNQVWGKLFDLPVEMRMNGGTVGFSSPSHLTIYNAAGVAAGTGLAIATPVASKRSVSIFGGVTVAGTPGLTNGQALFLTFGGLQGWIDVSVEI